VELGEEGRGEWGWGPVGAKVPGWWRSPPVGEAVGQPACDQAVLNLGMVSGVYPWMAMGSLWVEWKGCGWGVTNRLVGGWWRLGGQGGCGQ